MAPDDGAGGGDVAAVFGGEGFAGFAGSVVVICAGEEGGCFLRGGGEGEGEGEEEEEGKGGEHFFGGGFFWSGFGGVRVGEIGDWKSDLID